MDLKKKKTSKLQKLRHKYRLVILKDDTFEERFSIRLSRLNVFVVVGISAFLLVVFVIFLIAFTPLREFIPGYTDPKLRKRSITSQVKVDSLQLVAERQAEYIANLQRILNGEPPVGKPEDMVDSTKDYAFISNEISSEDSILRTIVEKEEQYSLSTMGNRSSLDEKEIPLLYPPVEGTVTSQYDPHTNHYAVDIVAPKESLINAVYKGTVVLAEWTIETGYVIQIQHPNNLISIYKHNSHLIKSVGEEVETGEAISGIGNSGRLTSGTHLHFELWQNGHPVDPALHIDF